MNTIYRFVTVCIISLAMSGCADTGTTAVDVSTESTTPAVFNVGGAPTVEFSVPDMMCPEGCAVEVKEILAGQPGAKDVRVDFEAKTATVAFDEDAFNADKALAALVDKQFGNSSLRTGATAEQQAADAPVTQ